MANPYFFISHKHADHDIALKVAGLVDGICQGRASIHLSSASEYEGPRVGRDLNDELKSALSQTQVLFLVYTDESQDWSYCMWECGVATDPNDAAHTNIVVIQCGEQAPVVYGSTLRVDVTSPESVETFVTQLCTNPTFVPGAGAALTGFGATAPQIRELAESFFNGLQPVVARHRRQRSEQQTSPVVRIEVPGLRLKAIAEASSTAREDAAAEVLLTDARIDMSEMAAAMFGVAIGPKTTFARLARLEEGVTHGALLPPWLQSIVRQMVAATMREITPVAWSPFDAEGGRLHLPFVTCYSIPDFESPCSFTISFMQVRAPEIMVCDRMLLMENVNCLRLAGQGVEDRRLADLMAERSTRFPILDESGRPLMIAHRSTITDFVARQALAGVDAARLRLADLLADPAMTAMFSSTFTTVGRDASLDRARQEMMQTPGCQDVFVTTDGTRNGEVLGWLANTMFVHA